MIAKALIKYGYINFRLEILEYCKADDRLKIEQYYLDSLKPEYNVLLTAGSPEGRQLSYETLNKLSGESGY